MEGSLEMTEQEFDNLEWQFISHFSTSYNHSTVDRCKTIPTLYRCINAPYENGEPTNRRSCTYHVFNDRIYNSKQKLLEVMNND